MKIKPITPQEAEDAFPDEVIRIFNEHILKSYERSTKSSMIYEKDIIKAISDTLNITSTEIYSRHLLDIEDIFRES